MRLGLYVAAAAALITGCATTAPVLPEAKVVGMPVPCVRATDVPLYPELRSPVAWKQPNVFERQRALLADYYDLVAYAERVRPLLIACTENP